MILGRLTVLLDANGVEFNRQMKLAQAEVNRFSSRLDHIARKTGELGKHLTDKLTKPILAIGAGGLWSFGKFDLAMTRSLAIMSGVTPRMRKLMAQQARSLSVELNMSATAAAKSYYYLASAGLNATQSLKALPVVARFAKAGAFDMAVATELATDAVSALGLKANNATKYMKNLTYVTDLLSKANQVADATTEQFALALTHGGAQAIKMYGLSIEDGMAALAAYADVGIKGAEAGNMMNRMLRLVSAQAEKNADEFHNLGVEVYDANGNLRSMGDILDSLEKLLVPLSIQERVAKLRTLGFRARIVQSILPLLGFSKGIKNLRIEFEHAVGTTEDITNKQMKAFLEILGKTWRRLEDVGITIGAKLSPKILDLADKISKLAESFSKLSNAQVKAYIKWGLFIAALGPGLRLISAVTKGLKVMFKAMWFLIKVRASLLTGEEMTKLAKNMSVLTKIATKASPWVALATFIASVVYQVHRLNKATEKEKKALEALRDMRNAEKGVYGAPPEVMKIVRESFAAGDKKAIENLRTRYPKLIAMWEQKLAKKKQTASEETATPVVNPLKSIKQAVTTKLDTIDDIKKAIIGFVGGRDILESLTGMTKKQNYKGTGMAELSTGQGLSELYRLQYGTARKNNTIAENTKEMKDKLKGILELLTQISQKIVDDNSTQGLQTEVVTI